MLLAMKITKKLQVSSHENDKENSKLPLAIVSYMVSDNIPLSFLFNLFSSLYNAHYPDIMKLLD